MKKVAVFVALALLGTWLAMPSSSAKVWPGDLGPTFHKQMATDPVVAKYVRMDKDLSNPQKPFYRVHSSYIQDWAKRINQSGCKSSFLQCDAGWDAIMGKKDPKMRQYMEDALAICKWGGFWHFKLQFADREAGKRAIYGAVLYNLKNASQLIAETLSSQEKFLHLYGWYDRNKATQKMRVFRESKYAYLALFYLGAKDKLDVMMDRFEFGGAHHKAHFLFFAHYWNLTPAHKKRVEAVCLKALAEPNEDSALKQGCMRYMAYTGNKNPVFLEHLMTYATGSDGWQRKTAKRALGALKHKPALRLLKPDMMQGKRSKTERVKKGRKFVQRKVDVWTATDDFVARVIALASLGDKDAMSAINYYLSINENGLVEYRGFRHLVFETTLASRAMQQKLIPLIKKALLKLKPHASTRGKKTEERKYRQAHIALLQMGDKTGFDHVMKVIGGHDRKVIMDVLDRLGGRLAPTSTGKGAQRIRVGKGGLSVKDATRLQDLIRKRMSFWPDRKTKEYAVRVIMELSGAIKAAS